MEGRASDSGAAGESCESTRTSCGSDDGAGRWLATWKRSLKTRERFQRHTVEVFYKVFRRNTCLCREGRAESYILVSQKVEEIVEVMQICPKVEVPWFVWTVERVRVCFLEVLLLTVVHC